MSDDYSYSKLDTYQQCPFKFYLKYILDNKAFSNSIATEVGTLIHETEESIANSIINDEKIDYLKLKNNIISTMYSLQEKYKNDFMVPDKSNRTYFDKIYQYLESGIYKLENFMNANPTYKIVSVEKSFNIEYSGKKFIGFIDRVFYDTAKDCYIIQDIKTYAVEIAKDKLTTPLQFVIYTLAVKELYNCTTDQVKCQYYLPFCDITQDAGTAGYMTRGTDKLNKLFASINSESFSPETGPLCNWCEFCSTNPDAPDEFKYLCPYYSLWRRDTRNKFDINKVATEWTGLDNYPAILESYKLKVKGVN